MKRNTSQEEISNKTKKKISINTYYSRSSKILLEKIISKKKWKNDIKKIPDNPDILWYDRDKDIDFDLAKEMRVSRIPGLRFLCQKHHMGYYLNKFRQYFPDDYTFFPKTYILPAEEQQLKKDFQAKQNPLYISKPNAKAQGEGLKIIDKLKQIPENESSIIQEYISSPLLIGGKKFDLRLFVLISSVEPLIAYLNMEGLVRLCTENYETPSKDNISNQFMHLTNYSINKTHKNYIHTEELLEPNDGTKQTLTSLWKRLKNQGVNVEKIKQQINELLIKFLTSMEPYLLFSYKLAYNQNKKGKCFQILGFDIMIDDNFKPWLLEVNQHPSMNIFQQEEEEQNYYGIKRNIGSNNSKQDISPLDFYVKQTVLEDAISISVLTENQQQYIGLNNKFQSYQQIYFEKAENMQHTNVFQDLFKIYGYLSGFKFQSSLTASKFVQLSKLPGMIKDQVLPKSSYDILYKKVTINSSDTKTQNMTFIDFTCAIEELAKILVQNFKKQDINVSVSQLSKYIIEKANI